MPGFTERLALLVTADAKGAIAGLEATGVAAKTSLAPIAPTAAMSSAALLKMGVAGAAAGAVTLKAMSGANDALVDHGREVLKLQRLTGGTSEELSKLAFVAKRSSIDVNTLGRGIMLLSKNGDALKSIGVSFTDATGEARPFLDVVGDVAERIKSMDAGAERNVLVRQLFGKSGQDLLPLLVRGRDGIKALGDEAARLGLELDQKTLEAIRRQIIAQKEWGEAMAGIKAQIGEAVLPMFTALAEGASKAGGAVAAGLNHTPAAVKDLGAAAGMAVGGVALLGGSLALVAAAARTVAGGFRQARDAALSLKAAMVATGDDGVRSFTRMGVAASVATAAFAAVTVTSAAMAVNNAILDIERRTRDALNALTAAKTAEGRAKGFGELIDAKNAEKTWGDFFSNLNPLDSLMPGRNLFHLAGIKGGTTDAHNANAAFDEYSTSRGPKAAQELIDSLRKQNDQLDRSSSEYKRTKDLLDGWQKSTTLAARAEKALTDTTGADTDATEENAVAKEKSALANRTYAESAKAAIQPFVAVATAQRSALDAKTRVADAERALNDLTATAGKRSDDYRQAVRSLTSAQRGLTDAIEQSVDAHEKLRKAQTAITGETDPARRALAQAAFAAANVDFAAAQAALRGLDPQLDADRYRRASQTLQDAADRRRDAQRQLSAVDPRTDPNTYQTRLDELRSAQRQARDADGRVGDARTAIADAQEQVNDATRKGTVGSKEYADAVRNVEDAKRADTEASMGYANALYAANAELAKMPGAAKTAVDYYATLRANNLITQGSFEQLTAGIAATTAQLATLSAYGTPVFAAALGAGLTVGGLDKSLPAYSGPRVAGARATGGPVTAGATYRVGERGPELLEQTGRMFLIPGETGTVTPIDRGGGKNLTAAITAAVAAAVAQLPKRDVVVNNHGVRNAEATTAATLRGLRRADFLSGVGPR